MKFNTKLTAVAAGIGMAVAGSAHASNLGEVWVGDQQNGLIYIADQSALNNPFVTATVDVVDLNAAAGNNCTGATLHTSARCADRMHIIGFSNHAGLDPASRAVFGYLDGVAEIWATNGGTHTPTKIAELQALGGAEGGANSLHMCGPSPDNSLIACSSIGGRKAIIFDANMGDDIYTRLGDWDLNPADMPISSRLKGQAKSAVEDQMAIINAASANPSAICNNFDTTSKTLYYTVQTSATSGGVVVLDVNDPANPTILDAWATPFADGCGLVNSPDGNYMWMNHGHNNPGDNELATKWNNSTYAGTGKITKASDVGPVAVVDIPEKTETVNGRSGDVHGAQFAGLGGGFLWEAMRIDDEIHIIDHNSSTPSVVNTIDLEVQMGLEAPQPDVLDRSALGTKMYFSTRGFIPTTAIVGFVDLERDPGIVTMSTLFGYNGNYMKTTSIRTGETVFLCPPEGDETDPDHDHDVPESCDDTHVHWDEREEVDTVDPHGLKSLQYLTGGF